ncbi:MAG: glycerophosphodiester phosphodiesterase family protein [Agriterribacter sp.]
MQKKISLLMVLFVVATVSCIAQSNLDSILYDFNHKPERILVASHRATHIVYPENSIAAMKESIRIGVDIIETDIRETKDGVLVIMHDKNIDRTTNGKGNVADLTYKELQQYYLLQDGKPTTEKIPTLKEVLALVKGKIMLDIDYKAEGERAARSTTKLLRKKKIENQCLFFLYDYKDAQALYSMNRHLQFLVRTYNQADVDSVLRLQVPVPAIHADDTFYTDSVMQVIRLKNKRVWMNALGKYDTMEKKEKDAGFDMILKLKHTNIIQTDLPEELLAYLKKRGLHR